MSNAEALSKGLVLAVLARTDEQIEKSNKLVSELARLCTRPEIEQAQAYAEQYLSEV